jgi:hypothetical protein
MRTLILLVIATAVATAAPALGDKPPKWEYAELTYRNIPGRPAGTDADGKEIPATPASVSIHWVTGAGETEVKGWDELADKLKATGFKRGSASFQKIQILNYLGSDGWELMEQQAPTGPAAAAGRGGGPGGRGAADGFAGPVRVSGTSTWMLKRRVP